MVLFTWFSAVGCQSKSEAGSLVAIFSVIIGWGIFFFWAETCEVQWAAPFVPYVFVGDISIKVDFLKAFVSQGAVLIGVIGIACFRYIKIKRYL